MSFTITEKYDPRTPSDGDNAANELTFLLKGSGTDTEEDARAALRAAIGTEVPTTLDGLKVRQCKIDASWPLQQFFVGKVSYESPDKNKDTEDSTFSFDTTGGQFKITQSKSTTNRYPAATAPDLKGAINVTDENVEGVEITIPQYSFSETHYIADADVNDTYKGLLYALTGTVNNATYKGCAAGECLFLGARGTKRGRGDWEITFNHAASPNVTGLTIGSITSIDKAGWDYLWVRYTKKKVGAGADAIMAQVPQFVYVERVYDQADFSGLGIGT